MKYFPIADHVLWKLFPSLSLTCPLSLYKTIPQSNLISPMWGVRTDETG